MAQTIKHAKVSAVPDGGDTNQVQPTDWNANHAITGTVDYSELSGKPSTFPPTLPIAESDVTNLVSDLALKAPLASPTFTGDPKAPTPATADNDTSIATTAHVHAAIAADVLKASTTEVLTGTDTAKTVTPDALAALWERGTDTAIAASLVLGEGAYFNLTGTGNITSISFQTPHSGRQAWLSFAFATLPVTLVNSANLILPGSADIVVAVGDQALVVDINGSAANTIRRVVSYMRLDGTTIPAGRASTTEVLTGTDTAKAVTPDALAALWEKGPDIAAAVNTVLPEGGHFSVTGTGVSIADITFQTPKDGRGAWIYWASAGNTLVQSPTLQLFGSNIVTVGGDRCYVIQHGTSQRRVMVYQRVDGSPLTGLASTTDVVTGTDTAKAVTPDALAALWRKGTPVAAAPTLVLGDGGVFVISAGTGPITDIDFGTASRDGRWAWLIFNTVVTLTHSANLNLVGAADITTAGQDMALIVQEAGDTVRMLDYVRANGGVLGSALASTTEVLTGTDTAKAVTPDALAALWEYGGDVAAAATVTFGDGGYFRITGTATITDIDFTVPKDGRTAWVRFVSAGSIITSGANLVCPASTSITVGAGDMACFLQASGDLIFVAAYLRFDGTILVNELVGLNAVAYTDLNSVPNGFQHIRAASPFTNSPIANNTTGFQIGNAGIRKAQMVFDPDTTTARAWMRNNSTTWGAWREFAPLDDPTFTGVVAAPTINLTGGQIAFPAAQNASAGVNVLDDYEEGTFTPAMTFGGAAVGMTFSTAVGKYTKIGNIVNYYIRLIFSAKGSSVGSAVVTGLPFTPNGGQTFISSVWGHVLTSPTGDTFLQANVSAASATIIPAKLAAGVTTQLADTDFSNTSQLALSGSYPV